MNPFKVGDLVKIIHGKNINFVGIVTNTTFLPGSINASGIEWEHYCKIRFFDGNYYWSKANNLELVNKDDK